MPKCAIVVSVLALDNGRNAKSLCILYIHEEQLGVMFSSRGTFAWLLRESDGSSNSEGVWGGVCAAWVIVLAAELGFRHEMALACPGLSFSGCFWHQLWYNTCQTRERDVMTSSADSSTIPLSLHTLTMNSIRQGRWICVPFCTLRSLAYL